MNQHSHTCLRSGCDVDCDIQICELIDECEELCVPCVAANLIDEFEDELENGDSKAD